MKAEVIAVDISEYRLQKAREFGAAHTIKADNESLAEEILKITGGQGVDTVFLTFLNQVILDNALAYVRDGGNLCIFAPPVHELELKMDYFSFFRRELHMFSSYSSRIDEIIDTMDWITSKEVDVEKIITGTTDLDNLLDTVKNLTDKDFNRNSLKRAK